MLPTDRPLDMTAGRVRLDRCDPPLCEVVVTANLRDSPPEDATVSGTHARTFYVHSDRFLELVAEYADALAAGAFQAVEEAHPTASSGRPDDLLEGLYPDIRT